MEAKFKIGEKVFIPELNDIFEIYEFNGLYPNIEYLVHGEGGARWFKEDTIKKLINKNDKTILDEAKEIVDGLRGDDYYDPVKNFRDISVMASIMTGKELSPQDCVKVLMAVKLTRESFKHKKDNLTDLCGYTYILDKIEES